MCCCCVVLVGVCTLESESCLGREQLTLVNQIWNGVNFVAGCGFYVCDKGMMRGYLLFLFPKHYQS